MVITEPCSRLDEERVFFTASPDDAVRRYLYSTPLDGRGAPARVSPADQTTIWASTAKP